MQCFDELVAKLARLALFIWFFCIVTFLRTFYVLFVKGLDFMFITKCIYCIRHSTTFFSKTIYSKRIEPLRLHLFTLRKPLEVGHHTFTRVQYTNFTLTNFNVSEIKTISSPLNYSHFIDRK